MKDDFIQLKELDFRDPSIPDTFWNTLDNQPPGRYRVPPGRIWIPVSQSIALISAPNGAELRELSIFGPEEPGYTYAPLAVPREIDPASASYYWPDKGAPDPKDGAPSSFVPFIMLPGFGWFLQLTDFDVGADIIGKFQYWEIKTTDPDAAIRAFFKVLNGRA